VARARPFEISSVHLVTKINLSLVAEVPSRAKAHLRLKAGLINRQGFCTRLLADM
jgi:hypothetical protein